MMIKRNVKETILAGVGILFCGMATSSFAIENQVKIGAAIDVQGVHYKTSGDATQRKFSMYNKNRGYIRLDTFL